MPWNIETNNADCNGYAVVKEGGEDQFVIKAPIPGDQACLYRVGNLSHLLTVCHLSVFFKQLENGG